MIVKIYPWDNSFRIANWNFIWYLQDIYLLDYAIGATEVGKYHNNN